MVLEPAKTGGVSGYISGLTDSFSFSDADLILKRLEAAFFCKQLEFVADQLDSPLLAALKQPGQRFAHELPTAPSECIPVFLLQPQLELKDNIFREQISATLLQMSRHGCGTCRAPLHADDGHRKNSGAEDLSARMRVSSRRLRSCVPQVSPVCFSRPDQHRERLGLVRGSDDEPLDDSISLAASNAKDWLGSPHYPAPLFSLELIDARASIDSELIPSSSGSALLPGGPRRAHSSASHALTSVDGAEQKGYEKAKLLRALDEVGHNSTTFKELLSATDLALIATKTMAQAIGRSPVVELDRDQDADKTVFLDSPVSPTGLFGPAVDGFAERFTAAQKPSEAMQHFLPKRSSSSASSCPKPVSTQQPPKATVPATQPKPGPEHRQHSRSARRHPSPKRQGPRPKIVLDPAPLKSA
ncbi:hypothetical protein DPX16_15050 [Anabarilius grahami]|uniref:Uncharacterized protein n=1 Tax=Anabarilius grahami TaxID=495550 RepID=A0A3N0YWX7_ANAGA|nr:hypothetical protein DPX16_15050 [Anabarilius grahami]